MKLPLVRHPRLWVMAGFIGAATLVAAVAIFALREEDSREPSREVSGYPYDLQTFPDLGREHLEAGDVFGGYNSDPPTSGPHAPSPAPWGVSESPLPKEVPVHNMEHAGVVVWYNCNGGGEPLGQVECQSLRGGLASIVQDVAGDGRLVLMTEYPAMQPRVALTAWLYLDAFDEMDENRVRAFIDTFECRFDPEGACG